MQNDLHELRHSTSHLLAAAIEALWPGTNRAIGPSIDDGFYYDFDFATPITESDLPKIEKKMAEIAKAWHSFERYEVSKEEALKEFAKNPYKCELINEFSQNGETISIYQSGNFRDLCEGGHIGDPKQIRFFKLTSLAGAYWRGNEKNKMLTRIYGTAFFSQKELDDYIHIQEEAKKRDHRKLGKLLDLFTFSDLIGSGFPLYTPRGALIRKLLNQYVEEIQSAKGYQQVWTPQVAKAELFKTSGHYDKYKDDMFRVHSHYSDEEFFLKPMNCPQHTQIYGSRARSYRDLPLRFTDFAMLYRDEKPGELSGLARVRSFSQDDCHIFCREDQVDEEIDTALSMTKQIMSTFGFKYRYRLSTRDPQHPEKYLGDPKTWDKVEKWAVEIMKRNNIDYFDGPGEAAFYAPKMDLMATDALGREWQLSTVQIDYVMPERFDLVYTDKDGAQKHPVMLHRAIIGSPERFIMILLEHFAGALPLWLSPTQVSVLPISEKHHDYSKKIQKELLDQGIRSELNLDAESIGKKIRNDEAQKTPYMIIVGDKEITENTISVRQRGQIDLGAMTLDQFLGKIGESISQKSNI